MKRWWLIVLGIVIILGIGGIINVKMLHFTSEPEFCAKCHPKKSFGPGGEFYSWEHSSHAEAGVKCLDCHGKPGLWGYLKAKMGGLKDLYHEIFGSEEEKLAKLENPSKDLVPNETCLFCHSDETNRRLRQNRLMKLPGLKFRLLDEVQNPGFRETFWLPDILKIDRIKGLYIPHTAHLDNDLLCADCHKGMIHRGTRPSMCTCEKCHQENGGPELSDCTLCHQIQKELYLGQKVGKYNGTPSPMAENEVSCEDCHGSENCASLRPNLSEACSSCHEDDLEDILQSYKDKAEEIKKSLDLTEKMFENTYRLILQRGNEQELNRLREIKYTLEEVANGDPTGIHNGDFVLDILHNLQQELTKLTQGSPDS